MDDAFFIGVGLALLFLYFIFQKVLLHLIAYSCNTKMVVLNENIPPKLSRLEHLTVNQRVLGSSPRGGARESATYRVLVGG